jgi:hypothetical protein
LLILSQLLLLSSCLHYRPHPSGESDPTTYAPLSPMFDADPEAETETEGEYEARSHQRDESNSGFLQRPPVPTLRGASARLGMLGKERPMDFWQWEGFGSYLEFLAGMIVVLGVLQVIFGRWMW